MGFTRLGLAKRVLQYVIWFALIVALFAEIYYQNWLALIVIIAALILTILPIVFQKKYNIYLPEEFEMWILIFIYLTLYLGDIQKFYALFWWWDVLLHGFSAVSIGIVGFIIMLYLQQGNKVHAKPFLICLFAFSFTVAAGAIWEIFEFSLDQIFGLTTQDNSLIDTMWDLIIDSIGAFVGSLLGYIYLKDKNSGLAYTIRSFVRLNSSMFKELKEEVSKKYKKIKDSKVGRKILKGRRL
jgi:hypothetical protein